MSKHKEVVKILNPFPGQATYTSVRRANQYIKSGRAILERGALRFVFSGVERVKTNLLKRQSLRTMDQAGYDAIGIIRLDQMQGLPLAGPAQFLIRKGKAHFTPPRAPSKVITTESIG